MIVSIEYVLPVYKQASMHHSTPTADVDLALTWPVHTRYKMAA